MRWRVAAMRLATGAAIASCARAGSSSSPTQLSRITRADIERVHAMTALDAVQRFRSDVLTTRAPSSVYLDKQTHPVVFLNDQFYGRIDELRNLPADGIEEIRFIGGSDAVTRYGGQYGGGIIQIISRTG